MKVTFIGLGIMGSRMAGNLLKNDVALTVFNRSVEPARKLEQAGAVAAGSYRESVEGADVVFTMLSTPYVIEQLAFGKAGFVPAMKENALWIDCSTVNPSFSLHQRDVAAEYSVRFIDAPVAGSKPVAETGELVFLAGGEKDDLAQAEYLLRFMGSKVIHAGNTGSGSALKMLVNSLLAQSMLAFSETVLLGEKLGLDRNFLLDTLPALPVIAPFTKAKAEMIRSGNYDVQFPLEWMHKDLHLAALTAYECGQALLSVNVAKELYAAARQSGLGREDFSAIYKYLAEDKQETRS